MVINRTRRVTAVTRTGRMLPHHEDPLSDPRSELSVLLITKQSVTRIPQAKPAATTRITAPGGCWPHGTPPGA